MAMYGSRISIWDWHMRDQLSIQAILWIVHVLNQLNWNDFTWEDISTNVKHICFGIKNPQISTTAKNVLGYSDNTWILMVFFLSDLPCYVEGICLMQLDKPRNTIRVDTVHIEARYLWYESLSLYLPLSLYIYIYSELFMVFIKPVCVNWYIYPPLTVIDILRLFIVWLLCEIILVR